uniref:Uncharacterized protein n=1 Tax=Cucumis melo TaxID=3656 RepID=A0A9I9ECT4_CUCME
MEMVVLCSSMRSLVFLIYPSFNLSFMNEIPTLHGL